MPYTHERQFDYFLMVLKCLSDGHTLKSYNGKYDYWYDVSHEKFYKGEQSTGVVSEISKHKNIHELQHELLNNIGMDEVTELGYAKLSGMVDPVKKPT